MLKCNLYNQNINSCKTPPPTIWYYIVVNTQVTRLGSELQLNANYIALKMQKSDSLQPNFDIPVNRHNISKPSGYRVFERF